MSQGKERGFFGLTSMSANVALEKPWSAETLAAVVALTSLGVRADVHRIGRHGHVDLVAMRTLASLLVIHAAMDLPVSSQIGRGAVPLVALGTHVNVPSEIRQGLGRRWTIELIRSLLNNQDQSYNWKQ